MGMLQCFQSVESTRHKAVGRIVATDAGGFNGTTGRIRLGVVKFFLPKWSRFFIHLFSIEEGTTEFMSMPKATKEVNSWTIKGSHAGVDLSRIETDRFWVGESQLGKVTLLSDVELWERPVVESISNRPSTNDKEWIQCAECDYLIDTTDPMIFCESCRDPYHSDCLFSYEKKAGRGYNPKNLDRDARKYRAAASKWNSRKTSKKSTLVVDDSELSDTDDAKSDDVESKEEINVKDHLICDACRTCRFCCEKVTESIISVTNGSSIEPFVVCVKCNTAAHGHCVFPPVPKLHSSVEWVCDECRECNSCGRVTYLNETTGLPSLLTDWALPSFDQCRTCFAGLDKGEYCPVCMKAWSVEWGGDMVQCDACEFWVHVACDDLGSVNLDKLETDNVTYTCPICRDTTDIHRRRRVTDLLRAIDKVALFSEPVSAAFMPVYLKVIKNPMDLSKMRKKSYANNLDFIRDFELIVENAKVFNMPNSPAYRLAEQFHKQGKLLIEKYLLTERKGASKIEGLLTVEVENAADNDDPTSLVTTEVSKRAASLMAEKMWKKDASSSARKRTTYEQALEMIRKSAPVSDDVAYKSLQSGAISPYKRRLSHPRGSGGLISPLDGAGSTTKPSSGMASPMSPVTLTLTFEELELTAAKLFGFTSLNYIRNRMTLFSGTQGSEAVTISVPADYSKILGSMKIDPSEIAGDARWSLFDMCAACGSFGEPWNLIECKDCGQCTHWFCAGLVGNPNETVVTGKNNALRRNIAGEASEFRYTCTSCAKCRYCLRGAGTDVTSSCCLCGARSHRDCRTKYFADNGLNPNMFRLNFSADTACMATPLTGIPVCEDCVLSQSLRFFKAETCRACDSLVNPAVASCYFKALPDSSAATVAVPGKSNPTVHCVACGDYWHARCLPEFSDVSASDILGIYVCNACLDSVLPVAGSTTNSELIDDVLGSMSRVLKQYRGETYKAIQAEFIADALRRLGGMSLSDRSSPLLYDLMDIFQGPSGNEYAVESVKLSEKEKQWIEWAMVHKDFFLGLGNPISELSKKKSSSTIGNETSVRIRRIEDEDLLLAKRLHSTYLLIDSIVSGQENVKPEFMDQSEDLPKMGIFPDRLTQIQSSRDFLLSGRSEVGARLLQLWWLAYANSGGYTGPRITQRKGKGISCIVDQAPPAWEFRKCKLCGVLGDHISLGHMLPIPADHSWVHTECVAWSFPEASSWLSDTVDINHARPQRDHLHPLEFEESLTRMPRNVDISVLKQAIMVAGICVVCEKPGATIYCQSCHTSSAFHLPCALSVNAAETAVSTQPRVLMDSRCRMLTCGKCLYRHPDNEKFFRSQFTASFGGIKMGQSVLDQVWSIRHDHNVKLVTRDNLEAPPEKGHLIREGTLTIINPGVFEDNSFVYDGSGPIIPMGYSAVRIFWQADLVLTSEDEENGVVITTNSKELPRLRKKRRGAYLCRTSEDGSMFSIQFVGGRLVAIGTSLSDVWAEFSFFLGHEQTSVSPEWFFGFSSAYMTKFLGDIAMRSIKRQAGLHRDKWMYQPQIRDYIVGVLGLKSELKPITSIRRDVGSRIAEYKARIDQLENLGRKPIAIHQGGLADEILEPGLVICEFAGNGEESSASLSSKPSRIKSAVVSSELPVSADSGLKYKVRSSIPDSHVLSVKRSKIHNYGLFSRNGFSKGEMVVEYQGEVLRQTIADEREKKAEREGDGDGGSCYMFKLDDDYVVDATVKGNCSRFINHSCNPNCTCKMIEDENRTKHIMIIAKRDILPGEEITYDYQFAVESEKLACLCGASNCLGRLN